MGKKKIKTLIGITTPLAVLAIGICRIGYVKEHTFILSDNGTVKCEQIQPVNGKVKFTCTTDAVLTFTDVESGKKYTVNRIFPGTEYTIQLEENKWYRVAGGGRLTIKPVNIRE